MEKSRKFGLIGYPVKQSFSPTYFSKKFKALKIQDASYKIYEMEHVAELKALLPNDIEGFNVTIPHKQSIMPLLDGLSKEAKKIGAVNTVKIEGGKWMGYNTDVYGFEHSVSALIGKRKISSAMVLGNGGATKAVRFVLKKLGIKCQIISRQRGYRSYKNLDKSIMRENSLIINTTPLGMGDLKKLKPDLPYEFMNDRHLLFDLIYNPQKTLFLKEGLKRKAKVKNGLEMLHLQAEKSWEIWNT